MFKADTHSSLSSSWELTWRIPAHQWKAFLCTQLAPVQIQTNMVTILCKQKEDGNATKTDLMDTLLANNEETQSD